MGQFDGYDLLFKIAIPLFFTLIAIKIFINTKVNKRPTFVLGFVLNLSLYILEIFIVFILLRQVFMYFGTTLLDSKDSVPKQFIDFFTAYQIFVFVAIKLFDSFQQDHYGFLIRQIEIAQPRIDENTMIEDPSDDRFFMGTIKYHKDGNFLPGNVKSMCNKLYALLTQYTELLSKIQKESEQVKKLKNELLNKRLPSEKRKSIQVSLNQLKFNSDLNNKEMKRIKFAIHDLKIDAIREKEKRDFHWNVSILLRLFR